MADKAGLYCQCSALTKRGKQCSRFGHYNIATQPYADPIWLCGYHLNRRQNDG